MTSTISQTAIFLCLLHNEAKAAAAILLEINDESTVISTHSMKDLKSFSKLLSLGACQNLHKHALILLGMFMREH